MRSNSQHRLLWLPTLAGAVMGIAIGGLGLFLHLSHDHESSLHEQLHHLVPLDAEERRTLDQKEQAFQRHRAAIETQLRRANRALADAIATDPRWSPEVERATRSVEEAAGDLQRATLVHIFEMRAGLKPEHRPAYDQALVEALRRGSR